MVYESDLVLWAEEQATLLREHKLGQLDAEHIAEEIEGLARRDRREIESRMKVLLAHLLKWRYQPALQSRSWRATIATQQDEIALLLRDSPSLRSHLEQRWSELYLLARRLAVQETGMETLPAECPWTLDRVLAAENAL
ncbi:MAG TPA: DUF29 domain-containing protein [Bryobacteraceae bacterium]